jgi:uncharacterized protein (UPF0218 family)
LPSEGKGEKILKIDEALRVKLKKPQGKIYRSVSMALSKAKAERSRGRPIITVGDRTTINFISNGFIPDLSIVDGLEMRAKAPRIREDLFKRVYMGENRAGTINLKLLPLIKEALKDPPSLLLIEGEEDLLTLLICAKVERDAIVFYGQPRKGMVTIDIIPDTREKFSKLLASP